MTTSSVASFSAASTSPVPQVLKKRSIVSSLGFVIAGSILNENGSPTAWAERAATGRRPSEPDPGNAGAGRSKVRPPGKEPVCTRHRTAHSDTTRSSSAPASIGLACAWRAAERGLDVLVIERERPGAGASNVAAGMLAPVGEATWGEDRLLELGARLAPALAAVRHRARRGRRARGRVPRARALHVALDRDEAAELRRRFDLMRSHGLAAEWLAPSACRELEPGLAGGGHGGVHAPHEAAVDPRALIAALVPRSRPPAGGSRSPRSTGRSSRATAWSGFEPADGAERRAAAVVLAAGSWSAAEWLPAEARPQVRPVKGQILTLAGSPSHPVCERIVGSERSISSPGPTGAWSSARRSRSRASTPG